MATITWKNGLGGDWATGANWAAGTAPGAADTAVIGLASATGYVVTFATPRSVGALTLDAPGGTLSVTSTLTLGGVLDLTHGVLQLGFGGAIAGGTIRANGGGFDSSGATLDNVAWQGTLDLSSAGESVTAKTGLALSGAGGVGAGAIQLTGSNAALTLSGAMTLGSAAIALGSTFAAAQLRIADPGTAPMVTLGAQASVTHANSAGEIVISPGATLRNLGSIAATQATAGHLDINGGTLLNGGQILVGGADQLNLGAASFTNAAGATVLVQGGTLDLGGAATTSVTNLGSIAVTGGQLNFSGAWSAANLGAVSHTGGAVAVDFGASIGLANGAWALGAGTALGTVGLLGTLSNGSVADAGGGLLALGGVLDHVAYAGTLSLANLGLGGQATTSLLTLRNASTVAGGIDISGANARVYVIGDAGFANTAITLHNTAGISGLNFTSPGAAATLTLGPQASLSHTLGSASILAGNIPGSMLLNQGSIDATASGSIYGLDINGAGFRNEGHVGVGGADYLVLGTAQLVNAAGGVIAVGGGTLQMGSGLTAGWTNLGSMALTGGSTLLGGAFTTAGMGAINHAGGALGINGTLDNTGATLTVGAGTALGQIGLVGRIHGGTLKDASGGVAYQFGSQLDGVAVRGTLDLSSGVYAGAPSTPFVQLMNGVTLTGVNGSGAGTILLTAPNARIDVNGSNTLDNATLTTGGGGGGLHFLNSIDQGAGAVLTLGGGLHVVTQAGSSLWASGSAAGDAIVANGVIDVMAPGSTLQINGNRFQTGAGGKLNVGAGNRLTVSTAKFGNIDAGGTLTGGDIYAAGTVALGAGMLAQTLMTNVTLDGVGDIQAGAQSFDAVLQTVGLGGSLHLLNGHGWKGALLTDSGLVEQRGGTLTGSLAVTPVSSWIGAGVISGAVANAGSMEVQGTSLSIGGSLTGAGAVVIDSGATLSVSGAVTGGQLLSFAGTHSDLVLAKEVGFAGSIVGFAPTNRIDLSSDVLTGATATNSTLTVTGSHGTQTFNVASPVVGQLRVMGDAGGNGSVIYCYALAQPSFVTPSAIGFGSMHRNDVVAARTLSLTNTAPATTGASEALDASIAGAPGVLAAGAFNLLLPGATDSTSLTVAPDTSAVGAIAGNATISLSSDGALVDGLGAQPLAPQTVAVSGAVYDLANPSLGATTLNFGAARTGDAPRTASISIANPAQSNAAFQEKLKYAVVGLSAGYAIQSGGSAAVAAGATATATLQLATTTAGDFSTGAAKLNLASTGAGTSGLADTTLPGAPLALKGKVYGRAAPQLATPALHIGEVHVGDVVTRSVAVTNAATGALTDTLVGGTATLAGIAGSAGVAIGGGLAAGQSGNVTFTLDTTAAGLKSGTLSLAFGSHDADIATDAAVGALLAIDAGVYNYAAAGIGILAPPLHGAGQINGPNLTLTNWMAKGSVATAAKLAVSNAATGLADQLSGSYDSFGASQITVTGLGAFTGLAAGAQATPLTFKVATGAVGVYQRYVVLHPQGGNAGIASYTLADKLIVDREVVAPTAISGIIDATSAGGLGTAGDDTWEVTGFGFSGQQSIDGLGGNNALMLVGGGLFDLRIPANIANIQTVYAQEGQSAYTLPGSVPLPNMAQAIYLRDAMATKVVVLSDPNHVAANPAASGITIVGGNDSATIVLGNGRDTVTLGSKSETVTAGTGQDLILGSGGATGTAGALVNGAGVALTTLEITSGGATTLNVKTHDLTVKLDVATNLGLSKAQFVTAIGSAGADTITAKAINQTLTGGAGVDTLVGSTLFGDTFADTVAGLNGDTIKLFGGNDLIVLKDMAFDGAVTRSYAGTTTAGTLKVTRGGSVASIKLAGDYTHANFVLGHDANGAVQIGLG